AQRFAKLRAEEMLTRQTEHFGSGTAFLRAGYQFTVEEHPMDAMNQKYFAIACEHFGNLSAQSPQIAKRIPIAYAETYHCDVTAIPASVQFRPKRETTMPRIYGLEHGLIDGEQTSDYAQIDDKGRYKVKFFFDESALKDGQASTWVRQMQPHGGGIEGFHFPLRKGTEVVLSFLGGDPDRPVIAGVVNTTSTPSPITSANNTRNVIQTGGRNRFEMEDQDGIQKISVSTPTASTFLKMGATDAGHELTLHTAANSLIQTDTNHDHIVGAAMTEKVTGPVTETYSATHTTVVSGAHSLTISGPRTVKVGAAHDVTITGPQTETINGAYTQHCNATSTRTVIGSETDTVVGTATRIVTSTGSETYSANYNHTVGAAMVQKTGGTFTQTIGGAMNVTAGPTWFKLGPVDFKKDAHASVTFGLTSDTFIGGRHSTNVGINVTANAASNLTLALSSDITLAKAVKATHGASLELNQPSVAKLSSGLVTITATGKVGIQAMGNLVLETVGVGTLKGSIVKIG
ncbi:MAG TPA: type VI secretion system tip protein VgrG, partial [Byssovorax sp.]